MTESSVELLRPIGKQDVSDEDEHDEGLLEAKDIKFHSSPVLHQKIRRVFLKYPFFLYDGVAHDVSIKQTGNLMSVLVNVSRSDVAERTAKNIWVRIVKTLKDKGAEIEFNEANLTEDRSHINFFLGSDILLKLR